MPELIPIAIFAAIMLASILISGLPRITLRIMWFFKWYDKQELIYDKRNYIAGDGTAVYRNVYILRKNNEERIANLQVFLRILMLTTILSAVATCIVYYVIA